MDVKGYQRELKQFQLLTIYSNTSKVDGQFLDFPFYVTGSNFDVYPNHIASK